MITQRVALGRNGQAIVVSHLTFDEDGFGNGQKTGILAISPNFSAEEMLKKAAKKQWNLTGLPNLGGFVACEKGRDLTEAELATAIAGSRSIQVQFQPENEEEMYADISHRSTNTPSQRGEDLSLEQGLKDDRANATAADAAEAKRVANAKQPA